MDLFLKDRDAYYFSAYVVFVESIVMVKECIPIFDGFIRLYLVRVREMVSGVVSFCLCVGYLFKYELLAAFRSHSVLKSLFVIGECLINVIILAPSVIHTTQTQICDFLETALNIFQ
jgi:hypothetical protein